MRLGADGSFQLTVNQRGSYALGIRVGPDSAGLMVAAVLTLDGGVRRWSHSLELHAIEGKLDLSSVEAGARIVYAQVDDAGAVMLVPITPSTDGSYRALVPRGEGAVRAVRLPPSTWDVESWPLVR